MSKLIIIGSVFLVGGLGSAITGSIISQEKLIPVTQVSDYTLSDPYEIDISLIDTLSLSLKNRGINIHTHAEDSIILQYYEAEHDRIVLNVGNRELSVINETDPFFSLMFFPWNFATSEIFLFDITIPTTSTLSIDGHTSNGAITITDITSIADIELSSSNGGITLTNIAEASFIELDTSNGAVKLSGVTASDAIEIDTSNGRITFDNVSSPLIDGHTSNGKIITTDLTTAKLDLSSSNGDITVSMNGNFTDYRINMSTTNGKYYLNGSRVIETSYHTNLENFVRLITSNGNVSLTFAD